MQEYKFVVTAMDGAPEPRIATATVTVHVIDTEDELPVFHQPVYEAKVPENMPDFTATTVTVSYRSLTLIFASPLLKPMS